MYLYIIIIMKYLPEITTNIFRTVRLILHTIHFYMNTWNHLLVVFEIKGAPTAHISVDGCTFFLGCAPGVCMDCSKLSKYVTYWYAFNVPNSWFVNKRIIHTFSLYPLPPPPPKKKKKREKACMIYPNFYPIYMHTHVHMYNLAYKPVI